jgi:hypothetical protein
MQTMNKFTPIATSRTPLSSQLPFALFVATYDWRLIGVSLPSSFSVHEQDAGARISERER